MDLTSQTNKIAAQAELVTKIRDEVAKVIVGQEKLIERLDEARAKEDLEAWNELEEALASL